MAVLFFRRFYIYTLLLSLIFTGCTFKRDFEPISRDKKIPDYHTIGIIVPTDKSFIKDDVDPGLMEYMGAGAVTCAGITGLATAGGNPILIKAYGWSLFVACIPAGLAGGALLEQGTSITLEDLIAKEGTIQAQINMFGVNSRVQQISTDYAYLTGINMIQLEHVEGLVLENNATNYPLLSSKGIDTVLELEIEEVLLKDVAPSPNVPVTMTLKLHGNLVNTQDGSTVERVKRVMHSNTYTYKEWMADDSYLLNTEVMNLLETAITSIIDELLLVYYPSLPEELQAVREKVEKLENDKKIAHAQNVLVGEDLSNLPETPVKEAPRRHVPWYVLNAHYPELIYGIDMREIYSKKYEQVSPGSLQKFALIKEQQPVLKWESFPWDYDRTPAQDFSEIVYDLEIYENLRTPPNNFKSRLIYKKLGLKKNRHRVEIPLKKGTQYLWTVRARFKLHDKPRVTEWAGVYPGVFKPWTIGREKSAWYAAERTLEQKKYYYYGFMIVGD